VWPGDSRLGKLIGMGDCKCQIHGPVHYRFTTTRRYPSVKPSSICGDGPSERHDGGARRWREALGFGLGQTVTRPCPAGSDYMEGESWRPIGLLGTMEPGGRRPIFQRVRSTRGARRDRDRKHVRRGGCCGVGLPENSPRPK